jgi:S-formylglutathione hydrolase
MLVFSVAMVYLAVSGSMRVIINMSSKNASSLQPVSETRVFGGLQQCFEHDSAVLKCRMRFSVFLPAQASAASPVPALYFLSGLTCTDENFSTKAGAQRAAAELGLALIIPDTSPRGDGVPDDEAYDLGKGAGFYVNATQAPWNSHYRMDDYISQELPELIRTNFPVTARRSISGHSMGGHGALVLALRQPEDWCSVSAFAPIVNPTECPWGQTAFRHYLGDDTQHWQQYDAVALIRARGLSLPLLVDQGSSDSFLAEQLLTANLIAVTEGLPNVTVRMQQDYDHSYYFIATFIEEHLRFHAAHLTAA